MTFIPMDIGINNYKIFEHFKSYMAVRKSVKAVTEKYMENFIALNEEKHCLDHHKSQYDITR